jgi:hypothetical protein
MWQSIKQLFQDNSAILILCFVIITIYLISGFGVTVSNDSVTNIDQIASMNIWSRSSHFSFNLFGVLFYLIFTKFFNLLPVTSLQLMLTFFSLAGSIALYIIAVHEFEDRKIAIISVILYAFSSGIYRFSIQAEYLVMVPSLALISLALYCSKRYVVSGIIFAFGLLTSPFILMICPAFLLFNTSKTILTRRNLLFTAGFLFLYLLVSIFTFKETVTGEWSYKSVFDYYKETVFKTNYSRVAAMWAYGYLRSFLIIIPFLILGLIKCYTVNRKLFYIILTIGLLHLPLALPEARYGAYQFTMYPFVAIIAAYALNSVFNFSKMSALTIIALFLALNLYIVLTERGFNRDLRETYVRMQEDKTIPDGSILFVYQAAKPIQEIYAPKFVPVNIMTGYQEDMAQNLPGYRKADLKEVIAANENLYLLESGTSMPDDNLKLLFSGFIKGHGVKVKGFGKEKLDPFVPGGSFERLDGYPIDLYKINK